MTDFIYNFHQCRGHVVLSQVLPSESNWVSFIQSCVTIMSSQHHWSVQFIASNLFCASKMQPTVPIGIKPRCLVYLFFTFVVPQPVHCIIEVWSILLVHGKKRMKHCIGSQGRVAAKFLSCDWVRPWLSCTSLE